MAMMREECPPVGSLVRIKYNPAFFKGQFAIVIAVNIYQAGDGSIVVFIPSLNRTEVFGQASSFDVISEP